MKIIIDTNIFLDFYRAATDPVDFFKVLIDHSEHLILTDQIEKEFSRNREQVLRPIIKRFENESKLDNISSSLVSHLPSFHKLVKKQKEYIAIRKTLIETMVSYLEDPLRDPVAQYFDELIRKVKADGNFFVTDRQIIDSAHRRKLIGDPPESAKYSIGDEINWEIILSNVKTDLILVGRDNTYTRNINHLKKEYHSTTGYFITHVVSTLTKAFDLLKIKLPRKVQKIESEELGRANDKHII